MKQCAVSLMPLAALAAGAIVFWQIAGECNWEEVLPMLGAAWVGIVAVIVCHAVPLTLDAVSWEVLFSRKEAPGLRKILWARWVGESVSNLLPGSSLAGDLVRVRWAAGGGVSVLNSTATVVVNITIGLLAQVAFTVLGLLTLSWLTGSGAEAFFSAKALMLFLCAVGIFCALQRYGFFRLLRAITQPIAGGAWLHELLTRGERIDGALQQIYADRQAIARCAAWSMAYWLSGVLEVWVALTALGFSSWTHALILEAAVQGVRSAFFFLPGALGAQEGGYVLAGSLLGIPAEAALSLSLIRRAREVAWGVPGLITWQVLEWRHSLRNASARRGAAIRQPAFSHD